MSEAKNLSEIIDAQINIDGPMSLSTYMGLCLTHPKFGYYKNADPLGEAGDFITAPEISQMFGEFIGLFIAQCWIDLGKPEKFNLVELGAGRGTLMADAFRVLKNVDGLLKSMQLFLLETNATLIEKQKERLGQFEPNFIEDIKPLEENSNPVILIANEFFDALPIKQFQKQNGQWHERAIGLKQSIRSWGLDPNPLPIDSLPENIREADDGSVFEISFASIRLMSEISKLIAKNNGAFLSIDYGYEKTQTGDSFQAVKQHGFVDPLLEPAKADLTAHVNFEALALAANKAGAVAHPLITQGEFLSLLGIEQRSEQLVNANPELKEEISAALDRLISEEQMGKLFKALCISSENLTPIPFGAKKS
jgi:SAM-dependent MidA family methyltransferase